jgi:hypothetical protein
VFNLRIYQKLVASFALLAVLFAQLAVASHPCPALAKAISGVVANDDCECPSEETAPSALCKKHCDNDKQNLAAAITLDAPAFFAAYSIQLLPFDIANDAQARAFDQHNPSPLPAPPLLKYANLRI